MSKISNEPVCKCGHSELGHYVYNIWSKPCAEVDDICCACTHFTPKAWNDFHNCVCGHEWGKHDLMNTGLDYCEGVRPLPCRCTSMRPITKKKWAALAALVFVMVAARPASAFTQIVIASTAPPNIEANLIAWTTTHYQASYFKNPLVPNTYKLTIFGYGEPQDVLGTSVDACYSLGFGGGMDAERFAELQQLQAFQAVDESSGTCAGLVQDTGTVSACQEVYNQLGNAMEQRWLKIYDSSGAIVAP